MVRLRRSRRRWRRRHAVIFDWFLSIGLLEGLLAGLASMKVNTACGVIAPPTWLRGTGGKEFAMAGAFVSISGGVAGLLRTIDLTPQQLITAADEALYQAKREGRNRFVSVEAEPAGQLA